MAKIISLEEALGAAGTSPPRNPSVQGGSEKRSRGEAMSIVQQFEQSTGVRIAREERLAMISDLMAGATFDMQDQTGRGSSVLPVESGAPVESAPPKPATKIISLSDALGAAGVEAPAPAPEDEDEGMGIEGFMLPREPRNLLGYNPVTELGWDSAKAVAEKFQQVWSAVTEKRPEADLTTTADVLPLRFDFSQGFPRIAPAEGGAATLMEADRLRMQQPGQTAPTESGFLANIRNPMELILNDSIPANIIESWSRSHPDSLNRLLEARKVEMQERILANPQQFPDVSVQAALQAKAEREAKKAAGVSQAWQQFKEAAIADPGKTGALFVNAILADPYMMLAPLGAGAKPVQAVQTVRGIETTGKIAQTFDRVVDAAATTGGLNVVADLAEQASRGTADTASTKMAFFMGAALGGALGTVVGRIPKYADLPAADKAKLDEAIDAAINGRADEVVEVPLTKEQVIEQQRLWRERLGIKTDAEAKSWRKKREADVKAAFKTDSDYADYLQSLDAERMAAEELAATAPQRAAEQARARVEASKAELPPAVPVEGQVTPEVLQALETPAFLRTAEQKVALRAAGMGDAADPSVNIPDNAEVIRALAKPPFQRTAEEIAAIKRSPLGRLNNAPIADDTIVVWRSYDSSLKAPSEGEGLYASSSEEVARQFGRPERLEVPKPKNALVVNEEPMFQLQELDEVFDPIKLSDSIWTKLNKRAAQDAIKVSGDPRTGNNADFEKAFGKALTARAVEAGYDAFDIRSGGDQWYVLFGRGGKPVVPKKVSGKASPELLARTAVVAGAGAAAYALAPKGAKEETAVLGALAGLIIPGGGTVLSKMRQAGAVDLSGSLTWLPDTLKLPDEPAVIQRAASGDQAAYAQLYKFYAPRLAKQMAKFVREAGPRLGMGAEDIVQETFIKAFQNLKEFRGDSAFGTWLYKIGSNIGLNAIEKSKRTVKTETAFNTLESDVKGGDATTLGQGAIMDSNSALMRPEVEAAAATLDTPENLRIASEVNESLNKLYKKLSDEEKQLFELTLLNDATNSEVAQALGISYNNATVRINRLREKLKTVSAEVFGAKPYRPKGQVGEVDPRLLKGGAVVSAGALAGAALNEENPIGGAISGGLVGLAAYSMGGSAVRGLDSYIGVISTRIKNISEPLHNRLMILEKRLLEKTNEGLKRVDPFLISLNKLPADVRQLLSRSILTNDATVTNNVLKALGDQKLIAEWKEVRKVLDSLKDQLVSMGRFKEGVSEYFPRIVKDYKGLVEALGLEHKDFIERAMKEANDNSIRTTGRELSELERSIVMNKIIQARFKPGGQPDFAKRRVIEDIPPELQKYYASPTESLHSYIRSAVQDIEMAKFFGKDLKNVVKSGQTYTNIDGSIGGLVDRLLKENKITPDDAVQLSSMLKSRFTGGMRPSGDVLSAAKNLANTGLLGNPLSAITQFGDTVIQAYTQDVGAAIEAVARTLTGKKKIDMESFGLATHMAEEFVSTTRTVKLLNFAFKWGGFAAIDKFGKNVALNAAIIRSQRLAKSADGIADLRRRYGEAFGDDFNQLVADLRAGKETDLTRTLAFSELSRSQPITRSELPQAYLDNPNGRIFYMLKTFMIKQFDLARRDGYNQIKKGVQAGDKKMAARGALNLLKLSFALGIAGMSTDKVKRFIKGEDLDFAASDIPMNALKTFGLSEYFMDKAGSGKPLEAIRDSVMPPYRMMDEIIRADPKAIRYIPIVGWFFAPQKEEPKSSERERDRRKRSAERRERRGRGD